MKTWLRQCRRYTPGWKTFRCRCHILTLSSWKSTAFWQTPGVSKTAVAARERRCHRHSVGPPPHTWGKTLLFCYLSHKSYLAHGWNIDASCQCFIHRTNSIPGFMAYHYTAGIQYFLPPRNYIQISYTSTWRELEHFLRCGKQCPRTFSTTQVNNLVIRNWPEKIL